MFDKTPLGRDMSLGIIEKRGNVRFVKKQGTDEVHPIAIAYCLYRYVEEKNSRHLTVSEFYRDSTLGGPYKIFGISKERLEDILRVLQESKNGILNVALTKGLDNITLRNDLNHIDVLKLLSREYGLL